MRGFIKATRNSDNAKIYVNVDHICGVLQRYATKDVTIIDLIGDEDNYYEVKESVETIMDRIMAFAYEK